MKTFLVYSLPGEEDPIFIKDGFSWFGFFFPWLAALRHSLFGFFLVLVAFSVLLSIANRHFNFPTGPYFLFMIIVHYLVGITLFELLQKKLEYRGAKMLQVILAPSLTEAQLLYYKRIENADHTNVFPQKGVGKLSHLTLE